MKQSDANILGADIGGTKVSLALFEWHGGRLHCGRMQSYPSGNLDGLPAALRLFLGEEWPQLRAAVFGVAGPVREGHAQITNLPWIVDAENLRTVLGTQRVKLINDLEATAYGILTLAPADLLELNQGDTVPGNAAVIAAGTGLGEGLLFWDGAQHHPVPSEGGHADFAPRNELETELWAFLRERHQHVSYERLLSGPGLVNIYEFLRNSGRGHEPSSLAARMREEDPAAAITQAALQGGPPLCVQALDLFCAIYGAEAGNLALKVMATGGVYVAGGIAPKIRAKLVDGTFMAAFCDKGRMAPLMDVMPVGVVLRETTALQGAGFCAARLLEKEEF
ncbi:MAG: glucokinase [Candidatus Binatia bacterium]